MRRMVLPTLSRAGRLSMAALFSIATIAALLAAPGAMAAAVGNDLAKAVAAPVVTTFSPIKGAAGVSVTIAGRNLTGATQVKFNGAAAVFSVKSATQIVATLPAAATTGKIAVTTPGGTGTTTGVFTVTVLKVTVTPAVSKLEGGETEQFTAYTTNATNKAVTWTATGGTISASGFYKAGNALGSFSVTATSVQDPTKSGTATITIVKTTTLAHPRIILDAPTLATLRARAQANTAEWQALKSVCDSMIGGTVLFPGQNGYPDLPSVGEGYQGDGYVAALMPLGLCYYTTLVSDPTTAAKYGAKGVAILMAMSNPAYTIIDGTPIWDRDDGYGIRNYGFGMGIGYDWFHPLLNSAQQIQLQTSLSHWINGFENDDSDNFEYVLPLGNYFAGFYVSECMAALAVEGESTLGDAWWNDWHNNQHLNRVVPYYAANMKGGGWPEGFAAYGPLASRNMALPALAVKTAKGLDIVHSSAAYPFPLDQGRWLMHFTWPSLNFIDDRDTVHSIDSITYQPGSGDPNTYSFFTGLLEAFQDPLAPTMHRYARNAKAALAVQGVPPATEWIEFLFWDDSATEAADYSANGLSHLAAGIGEMAARSDWTTGATWMSFRAGPYVDNPGAGEQGFDSGSLALVRGMNPLLINAGGWFAHNPNGTAGETLVYNDWYGNWDVDPTAGDRTLFNTFQVRHLDAHGVIEDNYGEWALQRTDGVRTEIGGFEDAGPYVFAIGQFLEDMYRPFQTICASVSPIDSATRQVVYLRPSQFVVYDRTTICDASLDQYLAFHFPANPVEVAAPATGEHRFNVTTSAFAGSMTVVLPASAKTVTTDKLSTDTTTYGRVWRTEIRPTGTAAATQRWMTVFDLAPSASNVASAIAVKIVSGPAVGALLQSTAANSVVVSGTARAGTAITGTLSYAVPAKATRHVVTDLTPSTDYAISDVVSGGNVTVSIVKGGSSKTSANGVLTFATSASGQVTK